MCRNIRQLHHFEPPATTDEADQIAAATEQMLDALTAWGAPKDREVEAAKAKARSAARFATNG